MAVLLPASNIQSKPAAIHSSELKGNKNSAILQHNSSYKKIGFPSPKFGMPCFIAQRTYNGLNQ